MRIIADQYVWLAWSIAFLIPWGILFMRFRAHRRLMLRTSLVTALFGLTEPIFVPAYWSPPSLFNLARSTGFDVESEIFTFAIGGVGAVLYNIAKRRELQPLSSELRALHLTRRHYAAILSPIFVFLALYFLPWNPIYPSIIALAVGAVATMLCRSDLAAKTWVGGAIFLFYYSAFLLGLQLVSPGYIARVWNFKALSGLTPFGIPIEEWLFAFTFGLYWTGVYEHLTMSQAMKHSSETTRSMQNLA